MVESQIQVINKIYKATEFCGSWYDIPVDRLRAHCWEESTWCEEGTNPYILSPSGNGKGCMQIDDRAHPNFGNSSSVFDILINISYGSRYLSILYIRNNNWFYASAAYNGSGQQALDYANRIEKLIIEKPWIEICKQAKIII
jgi:hypothetical protein